MKIVIRALVPCLVLAFALTLATGAEAQPQPWTVETVIGHLPIPQISAVGAGQTCEEARDNARDALAEDYFLFGVTYGACFCADVTDPFTGEYLTTLCSVKATAFGFRKFILLGP